MLKTHMFSLLPFRVSSASIIPWRRLACVNRSILFALSRP